MAGSFPMEAEAGSACSLVFPVQGSNTYKHFEGKPWTAVNKTILVDHLNVIAGLIKMVLTWLRLAALHKA